MGREAAPVTYNSRCCPGGEVECEAVGQVPELDAFP